MNVENKTKIKAPKDVIIGVKITEKSALKADKNIYTFNVAMDVTKNEVKKQIKKIYKVDPIKINIIKSKGKTVTVRGKKGVRKSTKKAMVYLKKSDKINIM